jgi:hypothetical protein
VTKETFIRNPDINANFPVYRLTRSTQRDRPTRRSKSLPNILGSIVLHTFGRIDASLLLKKTNTTWSRQANVEELEIKAFVEKQQSHSPEAHGCALSERLRNQLWRENQRKWMIHGRLHYQFMTELYLHHKKEYLPQMYLQFSDSVFRQFPPYHDQRYFLPSQHYESLVQSQEYNDFINSKRQQLQAQRASTLLDRESAS